MSFDGISAFRPHVLWSPITCHQIHQGELATRGIFSCLFHALGQHGALVSIQGMMKNRERLFAFHDDRHVVTVPNRKYMKRDANIRVHLGKIKVWNAGGIRPQARLWRAFDLPNAEQGIKVLGTSLGHEDFVAAPLGTDTVGAGHWIELS